MLDLIIGKQNGPRRMMLYGTAGIGKSTFAAMSDRPVFIQTEDGLSDIDCAKFPLANSLGQVTDAIAALYQEDHEYKTVVVDSLDWLERLIWAEVCSNRSAKSIEDIGYGKGYMFAISHWRDVLDGLTALRNERGMSVILLAHSKIERFENPETEGYDRYIPRTHKTATAIVSEWCDEVLFASYKVFAKISETSKAKGIGSGERVIRTAEMPAFFAKNRLGLPLEIPLSYAEYAKYLEEK